MMDALSKEYLTRLELDFSLMEILIFFQSKLRIGHITYI